ncbi:Glyoxalase/bleomycin resistance protein/dioxygenase [Halorhabdus utahensis DSM 12940]|uniref:Glyoxalase/bleomycin resistance protein/dioxygenase n=1 Tax=Halorhabdus utahensis (strain DSM 12940 / JCM 11049 / AX-2) TaxID=519442 RepID=C7NUJ5_HALUD|nr:VOC family protein [Halorhabdus utahensis]ACV12352.1 Glyoxalase/bleomycin resistance protein/dioxygenase [Halorhabdus utahensis DSM 12940]
MELSHVAIWVTDLDRSLDFYEALGFERSWSFTDDGVENVYVSGDGGELQLRHDPDRTTPIAPTRADTDHVALGVEDEAAVEAAVERSRDAGGSVIDGPHVVEPADAYAAFVEDPDGYTLEFVTSLEGDQ